MVAGDDRRALVDPQRPCNGSFRRLYDVEKADIQYPAPLSHRSRKRFGQACCPGWVSCGFCRVRAVGMKAEDDFVRRFHCCARRSWPYLRPGFDAARGRVSHGNLFVWQTIPLMAGGLARRPKKPWTFQTRSIRNLPGRPLLPTSHGTWPPQTPCSEHKHRRAPARPRSAQASCRWSSQRCRASGFPHAQPLPDPLA